MMSTLSKVGYKGGRKSYKESYDEKGLEDFEDVHPQGSHAAISSVDEEMLESMIWIYNICLFMAALQRYKEDQIVSHYYSKT